jgi:hypothetical protein
MKKFAFEVRKASNEAAAPISLILLLSILLFIVAAQISTPWKDILNSVAATLITIAILSITVEIINAKKIIGLLKLFSDHKQFEIERLFESRQSADYLEERSNALALCKEYKILSLVARDFFDSEQQIKRATELADRCTTFIALVADPTSAGYGYRYSSMEPDSVGVIGNSDPHIKKILLAQEKMRSHLANSGQNNSIKRLMWCKVLPVFHMEFIDELLFVSFYGTGSRGTDSPILMFKKQHSGSVYKYFCAQFENCLAQATDECPNIQS